MDGLTRLADRIAHGELSLDEGLKGMEERLRPPGAEPPDRLSADAGGHTAGTE